MVTFVFGSSAIILNTQDSKINHELANTMAGKILQYNVIEHLNVSSDAETSTRMPILLSSNLKKFVLNKEKFKA